MFFFCNHLIPVDTPDPYVKVTVAAAIETILSTKGIDNDVNPIWNEDLSFFLSPDTTSITGQV